MTKIGIAVLCLFLLGGLCVLGAVGHAVLTVLCRCIRPFDEWRNEQIRIIEAWQEEDEEEDK